MRKFVNGGAYMILASIFAGRTPTMAQEQEVPVWTDVAPGSESWTQKEEATMLPQIAGGGRLVRNVTRPTLTAFLPDAANATQTAVIICPGGGFQFLPWEHEGTEIAKQLRARGIAAFVLKYRLIDTGPTQQDFQKSVAAFLALVEKLATAPPEMRSGLLEPMQRIAPFAISGWTASYEDRATACLRMERCARSHRHDGLLRRGNCHDGSTYAARHGE